MTNNRRSILIAPMRWARGGVGAFTLLVVVINAYLLAVLRRELHRAVQAARQTVCILNLRQMGAWLATYMIANRRYPVLHFNVNHNWVGHSKISWLDKSGANGTSLNAKSANRRHINPYLGVPYDPDDAVPVAKGPSVFDAREKYGSSYVRNADLFTYSAKDTGIGGHWAYHSKTDTSDPQSAVNFKNQRIMDHCRFDYAGGHTQSCETEYMAPETTLEPRVCRFLRGLRSRAERLVSS